MTESTSKWKELRGGIIVAAITVCLFLLLVASFTAPGLGEQRVSPSRFNPVYPQTLDHLRASLTPVHHTNDGVPVFCHHFLRQNTSPFEVVKILGALFLNLPLLDDLDVWTQTASAFEKEIVYLKEQGYTAIGVDELVAWRSGAIELPEKSVVITFDDGARSVLEIAYPILKRHGMKATLYIVTSRVGKKWEGFDVLTWDELWLLQSSGVFTIESHTHGLHHIVRSRAGHLPVSIAMSEAGYRPPGSVSWHEAILDDLTTSRRLIAEHLGHDARHLAWPYGGRNAELDSLATLAGFRSMATLEEGANARLPVENTGINRYLVTARTSIRSYSAILPR
jgi:peptidoglycan/xylan/chitin deacetylase (PgdA/CDA1 family)